MISIRKNLFCAIALFFAVLPAARAEERLLKAYPLQGQVKTTQWSMLASVNKYRFPDELTMKGTMTVALPGYGAGMGLYSWTGPYSITVTQPATTAPTFAIKQAVFQLDVTWDPSTTFPQGGGPKLSYNGGNQQIPATLPMIVDGLRVVENETGVPEMENIDSFAYRGITWQWDLSSIPTNITTVTIQMPFANHTSVVGARIDVASQYTSLTASVSAYDTWKTAYFGSSENTGLRADLADYDHDGVSNLLEYALGTDPTVVVPAEGLGALPTLHPAEDRLAIRVPLPEEVPADLVFKVQVSDGLSSWTTLASKSGNAAWSWLGTGSSRITTTTTGGRTIATIEDDQTRATKSRRMMRLSVVK